ncbi:MAG: hypothetical protein NDI61_04270, partial [Bdellovibrionaceae bacterium]|nr:hypothetical protein [Pseudobdellovibrionaceae bacterium]
MEAIPRWLSAYLDSEGKARIEAAIAKAEAATSGEIVPMIVHRSTHTGHVRWILFFALVSVLVALAPSGLLLLPPPIQTWMPLLGLEAGMIAIAWVFAAQLARMDFFQRLCTPEADQDAATMMRAELEFFESGIKKTQAQTGVLIFVSLLEHEA